MLLILMTLVPVFGIMLLGMVAYRQKILPVNVMACLNQFIYWYSLPLLLFYLMASVDLSQINVISVWAVVLGMLVVQMLGTGFLYANKCSWRESLVGGLTLAFPNIAYMGLPTIILLFPGNTEAKAMAGLVALAPTVSLVLADVLLSLQGKGQKNISGTLGDIFRSLYTNPALIGASMGIIVSFGEIPVPQGIMQMAEMLGSASAPCSLFCMGLSVASQLSVIKQGRTHTQNHETVRLQGARQQVISQSIMVVFKLVVTPLCVYGFGLALGATGISLATMTILSAMPTAIICHIIAVKHQALEDGCARAVLISTLLSVGSMPVVIRLLQ